MRKFSSEKIFDGHELHTDKMLVTDDEGTIIEITNKTSDDDIEYHPGILTPGLVNCHCHLELSHLKNVIPPHTGLIDFLCSVVAKRNFPRDVIDNAIVEAEKEMFNNGIVAVGDIANTADTAAVKSSSKIFWQNFVEVLSFTDEHAEENISKYLDIAAEFLKQTSTSTAKTTLVPHAPYTISPLTFKRINELTRDRVISIHNQEHPAEDELYKTGKGDFLRLFRMFGMDVSPFPVTGESSLRSVLPYFNQGQTILLVHNTYTPSEDVDWAIEYASKNSIELVFCFCVNANLYIENNAPDLMMFHKKGVKMVIGTDSYSSNWHLSVAKEIHAIHMRFPELPIETLLRWATSNGASAFQRNDLGSFKKGSRPGVVAIDIGTGKSERVI